MLGSSVRNMQQQFHSITSNTNWMIVLDWNDNDNGDIFFLSSFAIIISHKHILATRPENQIDNFTLLYIQFYMAFCCDWEIVNGCAPVQKMLNHSLLLLLRDVALLLLPPLPLSLLMQIAQNVSVCVTVSNRWNNNDKRK